MRPRAGIFRIAVFPLLVCFPATLVSLSAPFSVAADDKDSLTALAVSADGTIAITGARSGGVRVWDLAANEEKQSLDLGHPVLSLALAPDGKLFAAGGDEQAGVRLYQHQDARFEFVKALPEAWTVPSVAISPDGKTLAFGRE